ncbi:hypothetical protein J5N97_002575 [Dioscorea zingiberensis]|uniref:Retrotransposon gag domain-containing protein n=1 Tax=Dioscorea zingiberensis TaxID=325984 RepID=A0A9D5D462_9LILI|nr:hypothetical protein J5N97_002575 [Dioscorea zingiberensis]
MPTTGRSRRNCTRARRISAPADIHGGRREYPLALNGVPTVGENLAANRIWWLFRKKRLPPGGEAIGGAAHHHVDPEREHRGRLSERERVLRNVPRFRSPFIRAIWEAPFPEKYIPPNIRLYDGTSDPYDHVERYCSEMSVNGTSEVVLCRGFSKTLSGIAYDWFRSLPEGSIAYFDQLMDKFLRRFANCRRHKRNPVMLLRCKQREGESLRDYLDRFNDETQGMSDLDSIMVVGAVSQSFIATNEFKAGRREQALQRAEEFRREEYKANERAPQRDADQTRYRPPRNDDRGPRDLSRPRIRARYDNYTPLNTPRERIMMQIQDKKILKQPEPVKETSSAKKSSKYCIYHKVRGHTTENCIQLKDAIEDLVREGKLAEFLKQEPSKKEEQPSQM